MGERKRDNVELNFKVRDASQVQPWTMAKKFDQLNESMQNYYNNSANLKKVSGIKVEQYCALKHTDDIWYR